MLSWVNSAGVFPKLKASWLFSFDQHEQLQIMIEVPSNCLDSHGFLTCFSFVSGPGLVCELGQFMTTVADPGFLSWIPGSFFHWSSAHLVLAAAAGGLFICCVSEQTLA